METTDVVLLDRWLGGRDAEAFRELVKRHSAMVFSACRRMLGDAVRAEDVTQECFLKLATVNARPTGPFMGPWLHKLATRRCLDTLRSERRRQAREARYMAQAPQAVEVPWETLEPLVDEALATLPEHLRVPVTAHFLEGLSHDAIARRLEVPRRTVSNRISQGLDRMGEWLRSRGVGVASGVLMARLGEIPVLAPPAELTAKLSKMALARAARALPHAHWLSGSVSTLGVSVCVAALVTVAGFARLADLLGTQDESLAPVFAAQTLEPAADAPKGVGAAVLAAGGVAGTGQTGAAVDVTPSGRLVPAVVPPAAKESTPGTVTGSVVDEDDVPIPNATVRALLVEDKELLTAGTKILSAKTDANGRFRIAGVPSEGGFLMDATAEGIDTTLVRKVQTEPGQALKEQRFVLRKQAGMMLGKVFGRDGLPVKEAQVLLHSYMSFDGGCRAVRATQTDKDGLFKMGVFGPGVAELRVQTLEWGDAIFQVNVEPGVLLELHMPEPAALAGRVTGKDGAPAAGAKVALHPLSGSGLVLGLYQSATDADGRYAFAALPSGVEYEATVQNEASKPLSARQRLGTLAAGSSTQHEFNLLGSAHVRGVVLGDKKGRPQKAAEIGWVFDNESEKEAATAGEDGTYDLELFAPGTYWVYAIPATGEYDEEYAKKYGRSVTVTMGTDQTLDLRLPEAFSLGVRAVDAAGNPVANAVVTPEYAPRKHFTVSFDKGYTDASGCYRFEAFQPGFEAWLMVSPPAPDPLLSGSQKADNTLLFTPHVKGESGVDYPDEILVVDGSSGLRGVALGDDGRPLANCKVALGVTCLGVEIDGARVGGGTWWKDVKTDDSGVFTLPEGVPATPLVVNIGVIGEEKQIYESEERTVDGVAGGVADLGTMTFQLDPDAKPTISWSYGTYRSVK